MSKLESATTGKDSLLKAILRNMAPRRIGLLFSRGFSTLRTRGFEALYREFDFRWRLATHGDVWRYRADIPLGKELKKQRKKVFEDAPLISIIVPLYNTPEKFLQEMIISVTQQSYPNWELVLIDGSDKTGVSLGEVVKVIKDKENRINYIRLRGNNGIAGNTNLGFAESTGDYITLLDHDDVLQPNALYEVVKSINETKAEFIYSDEIVLDEKMEHLSEYHFKPDYAQDTLRGCNYITHLAVFKRRLLESIGGGENSDFDGAQDYDLILRLTQKANKVHHIPKVLYFWREHGGSTAQSMHQKPYALAAGAGALQAHLEKLHLEGEVSVLRGRPGAHRIRYKVWGAPKVSVLIPSKDHIEDLERCLESLYKKAGWQNMEVLVLENNSSDAATEAFYEEAQARFENLQVLRYQGGFNFANICNFGAARAKGDHLLFLNNDTEIISDGYVKEMVSYSQRPDVGAVGSMLYYPDETVQHAGLIIGIGGTAGVSHKGHPRGDGGDLYRLATVQNVSAVTGASLMMKSSLYKELGGMDGENFAVAFNDVDLCLRLREKGLLNVFTPFATAWHYESKSRGYDTQGTAKERFEREANAFKQRHADILQKGDPYYNPHFTLLHENFGYA